MRNGRCLVMEVPATRLPILDLGGYYNPPVQQSARWSYAAVLSHDLTNHTEETMAKAYWVVCYRSISDPTALNEYAKLAAPAILAGGGRFPLLASP